MKHNWLLPEHIEDLLPVEAQRLEQLRRKLLDLFHSYGYRLVVPPLLEYLESLNAGVGHDLDLLTFKVVDQLSGRLMGIRSDITPQAARIDAHRLNQAGVTRLCYAESVLRTQAEGADQSRQPLQIGAELFGHVGLESDLEIQRLMVQALQLAGVRKVLVDFSHVAIFRALVTRAEVSKDMEGILFAALQAKDVGMLTEIVAGLDAITRDALLALPELHGAVDDVLPAAQQRLPQYAEIKLALQDIKRAAQNLTDTDVEASVDLAELRGYHYHTGVVFAAYTQGYAGAVALGGRYDQIGQTFGRARPATGFSLDLRTLMSLSPLSSLVQGILAPYLDDATLQEKIATLRAAGEMVIVDLPGHEQQRAELNCDRMLVNNPSGWEVVPAAI
ncbi:MAG: ATP phosphoribosyltransferase regulatory subunit [Methylophilaceae bacterium]